MIMRRTACAAVLFWWFVMLARFGQPVQVGPFDTLEACGRVRAELVRLDESSKATECWECPMRSRIRDVFPEWRGYYPLPDMRLEDWTGPSPSK